jgi:tRNA(fMet)-specific endonuclease VapC
VGRRLILDTNILIDYERGTIDRTQFDDDDLAIAAVTVAEFHTGIELARTAEQAADRARSLAILLEMITVLDYSEDTATHHARLLAATRRAGRRRGAHDLIIAAHAAQSGRDLVSRDAAARFGELPGVSAADPA